MTVSGPTNESANESANESTSTHRFLLGVVAPIVCVAIVAAPFLLTWSELPDPVAVKWGTDGQPNNSISLTGFLGYNLAAAVLCAVMCVAAAFKAFQTAMLNAMAGVLAGVIAPTFAVISLQVSLSNRRAADWTEAASPSTWWIVGIVVASMLGAIAISFPLRNLFQLEPIEPTAVSSAGLTVADGQSASWHSQASSPWWRVVAVAFGATGVVLVGVGVAIAAQLIGLGLFALAIGSIFLFFSQINVAVDQRGLTVQYGSLPWPKNHIGLASIDAVEAIHVKPLEHGGWGYRGSRKLLGRAAVVVRAGQGIRLSLKDGTDFVVTVDNADQGAGVLNDLRAGV